MKAINGIYAFASLALVACSSDEFIGSSDAGNVSQSNSIVFSTARNAMTRATTGEEAAKLLKNKFVVEGTKGGFENVVFDNYLVEYNGKVNSTSTNTEGWDYVGGDQLIKYWDYSQEPYFFIAYSNTGSATVSKITPATATDKTKGAFTIKGKASDVSSVYLADLDSVNKTKYQETVTLKFSNANAKIKVGLYETVPGYHIKDVKFYNESGTKDEDVTLYNTETENIVGEGKYIVYFDKKADGTIDPTPKMVSDGTATPSKDLALSKLKHQFVVFGEDKVLGTTSSAATFTDTLAVFPMPASDAKAMTLKVDYTLIAEDTKEEIKVTGAKAIVPKQYVEWKSNYMYTYLFKISNNTNGTTGDPSDPEGLYPITFDAVVESTLDGIQSTITTVATPSITTYQDGASYGTDNEYKTGKDIVITVDGYDASAGYVYKVTTETGYNTNCGITEATVNDALKKLTGALGTDVTGDNKIKLSGANAVATYSPTDPVTYDAGEVLAAETVLDGYYTKDSEGNYTACASDGKADGTTTYYKQIFVKNTGYGKFNPTNAGTYAYVIKAGSVYAIKIIKVQ